MSSASSSSLPTVAVPVRILVQTVTGLVPGDLYLERIRLMRNIICQHFWNRDFDSIQERFQARGADFGFDNRVCYFLLDSGINFHITQDPPVFWYRWTGDSLSVCLFILSHFYQQSNIICIVWPLIKHYQQRFWINSNYIHFKNRRLLARRYLT